MTEKLKISETKKVSYLKASLYTVIATLIVLFVRRKVLSVTAEGGGQVVVQAPLSIVEDIEMDFGTVIPPAAGENITIPKNSDTISCPTSTCFGSTNRGKFLVNGVNGTTVNISYVSGTLSDGTNSITLDVSSATIDNEGSLLITGTDTPLYVGGILEIGASQPVGTYNASNGTPYQVTIDY